MTNPEAEIANLVASLKCGSVVAAAGCGKTEQIVRATQIAEGRRLILTHTHAGVDALRKRFITHKVESKKFRVDTIAGWCLLYAISFPKWSGLSCAVPKNDKEWSAVYEATARLIQSGAVKGVLTSSYSGVFVDEYQDCSGHQHRVIKAIAPYLPVCVFGDPLQAIFDFKGQSSVDWSSDVFPVFSKAGELNIPWRWRNAGNEDLSEWLRNIRSTIEQGGAIDLRSPPTGVTWQPLPEKPALRQSKVVSTCKALMNKASNGYLVVIGDPANINVRANLAKNLAAVGFSNIEPLDCKDLYKFAERLEGSTGLVRLEIALDFICACMIRSDKTAFISAVKSHLDGSKRGAAKFGALIEKGIAVVKDVSDEALLELMHGFSNRDSTRLFRRQMFFAMCSALRIKSARQYDSLAEAIWQVQNRTRHTDRIIGKRSIGSTLLVKGLEFDHVVIVHSNNMSRKDWYVALTRATTSLTILAPSEVFSPAEK